ncbi:MAG: ABC transporter permease, partial [Ilumatobacter sp.]
GVATFGGADSLGPTTYAAFTTASIETLLDTSEEVSSFRLAAEEGVSQDELRATVARALPPGAEALTGAELTDDMVAGIESDFLGLFRTIMVVFAAIALIVAAFSIHNTFSILIAQRTRESALLRAIGASRRQVLASVVAEAMVIGAVASGIGLLAGFGLARGFVALLASAGLDLNVQGVVVAPSTVMSAAAVGIVATLVASILPAVRASRVAPLAALRESATGSARVSLVRAGFAVVSIVAGSAVVALATSTDSALVTAGVGAFLVLVGAVAIGPAVSSPAAWTIGSVPALLRGQTGHLARRNAMRDPRRTSGSASALMVGTAIVVLFTTFGASIKATIEQTVNQDFGGDLVVVTDNFGGPGISADLAGRLDDLPEITTAVGFGEALVVADGVDLDPTVADPARLGRVLDLGVVDGSLADVTPGRIAVSESWADDRALATGEAIDVSFADGETESLTIGATYATTTNVGDMLLTPEDWADHAAQVGDVVVLVDLADGISEEDGRALVEQVGADYGAPEVQTRSEYIDTVGSEVDQMLFFVYGMLALAILIALMGIANTLSLSIHERTRELGLLRAVGQTRAQVRSTVRWESVIVAVFGTLGGVGVGTFLGWGLMRALAEDEGFGVFALPVTSLAIVVVLAALAGVIAAWRPARRAARL